MAEETKAQPSPSKKGRLLIVDDSPESREILSILCKKLGHDRTAVESGEEALEIARMEDFDVIILDIMMPGIDGFEVLTRLKKDPLTRHIPVLMLSGFTELDSIVRCIQLGAEDYLLKPFKTIGDAYMAVAGVPERCDNHAERAADMSLAMLEEIQSFNELTGHSLNVRIGLHSGPVVAGVIGTHKFTYDLWGDTVNIASRMESHGHPRTIQVSANTERILRDKFLFITRGRIEIKGQGELMTYLLGGKLE